MLMFCLPKQRQRQQCDEQFSRRRLLRRPPSSLEELETWWDDDGEGDGDDNDDDGEDNGDDENDDDDDDPEPGGHDILGPAGDHLLGGSPQLLDSLLGRQFGRRLDLMLRVGGVRMAKKELQ